MPSTRKKRQTQKTKRHKKEKKDKEEKSRKPSQKRVYWDHADKERICKQVILLRKDHPSWTELQCIRHIAENALPEDKRRNITTMSTVPWFPELYRITKKLMGEEEQPPEPTEPPKEEKKEPTPQEIISKLPDEVVIAEAEIRKFRATKNVEMCLLELATMPSSKTAEQPRQIPKLPEKRKPTLVVIGLKSGLNHELKMEFQDRAHMEFYGANEYSRNMPAAARYFMATSFIPHKWDDRLKVNGLLEKTTKIKGGISSFRDRIREFLNENNGQT